MPIKGDLSTIGLAEVFQMISMAGKEGTLMVQDAESAKSIYFGKSGVQLLSTGKRKGLRIGDMLVRAGRITEQDLNDALENAKIQKKLVGEVLVEGGIVSEKDINDLLRVQVEEEIYDLFLWKTAGFEFIEGPPATSLQEKDAPVTKLSFDVNGLLLEAVRRADEWTIINQKIPSLDAIFLFTSDSARQEEDATSADQAKRLYRLVDGNNTVNEMVEATGVPKFDTCKVLVDLIDRGRIRMLQVDELADVAGKLMSSGRRDKAVRLYQAAASQAQDDPMISAAVAKMLENEGVTKEAASQHARTGRLYMAQQNLDKALEHTQRAIELNPDDDEARMTEFEIYAGAGDLDEGKRKAHELIKKALMVPDYPRARKLVDRILSADATDMKFRVLRAKVFNRIKEKRGLQEDLAFIRKNMPADAGEAAKIHKELQEIPGAAPGSVVLVPPRSAAPAPVARKGSGKLVAIVVLLLLAGMGGVGGWYEWNARQAFESVSRQAREKADKKDFEEAKRLVEAFKIGAHSFSVLQKPNVETLLKELGEKAQAWERERKEIADREAVKAVEEMGRLASALEEEKDRNPARAMELGMQLRSLAEKAKHAEFMKRAEDFIKALGRAEKDAAELKAEAERLEGAGKFAEAARMVDKLLTGFPNSEAARGATYPVGIRTQPRGVKVTSVRSGLVVGVTGETPLPYRVKSGETVKFLFEKAGYKSMERNLRDKTEGDVLVELTEKTEAWVMPLGITVPGEPLYLGDTLYVGASSRLYAVGVSPKGLKWSEAVEGRIEGSPKSANRLVYVATTGKRVYAFDPLGGESRVAWKSDVTDAVPGSPALSPDGAVLYVVSSDRKLHALDARQGTALWTRDLPAGAGGEPLISGGQIIVACQDGTLVSVKGPGPEDEAWKLRVDGALGPMALAEGTIYAVGADRNAYAVDPTQGRILWKQAIPNASQGRIVRKGNALFVPARDGRVHLLEAASGKSLGTLDGQGAIAGGVAVQETTVFFGTDDHWFYAFDAGRSRILWRFKCAEKVRTPPVLGGGCVYFAGEDSLFAIELN